jgi:hypothetical protein
MYKIVSILVFSVILPVTKTNAQPKSEAGFFAGTSYYLGDINPSRQFYSPSLAAGAMMKIYFNERHCLRFQGIYGQFQGNDHDFANEYQQFRNASFSASLLDFSAIYEFNFLPFRYNDRKTIFSPFLFGGVGYDVVLKAWNRANVPVSNHLVLPFGTGIKYLMSKKVTVGFEWGFRKTFIDNIDGVENPGQPNDKSLLSNKDWYSFAGFFITFRLFDRSGECPVYRQK